MSAFWMDKCDHFLKDDSVIKIEQTWTKQTKQLLYNNHPCREIPLRRQTGCVKLGQHYKLCQNINWVKTN